MHEIMEILATAGPLTGKELLQATGADEFSLWAACNRNAQIVTKIIGRRYLRLDRQVDEYARLSPSIMREFHGYTVIGTANQEREILLRAALLQKEIGAISKKKFALAQATFMRLTDAQPEFAVIKKDACFMIAGDVVYGMSHAEPRPEASTGELVRGSDLDVIIVFEDLPEEVVQSLDAVIHREKHKLLVNPACREEIDYIVKDSFTVQQQLQSQDFKAMVAAKILNEAQFLYGSQDLYNKLKRMLVRQGIPGKMRYLENKAQRDRENAEVYLLNMQGGLSEAEAMKLFYTAEEKEEIF